MIEKKGKYAFIKDLFEFKDYYLNLGKRNGKLNYFREMEKSLKGFWFLYNKKEVVEIFKNEKNLLNVIQIKLKRFF